MFIRKLTPNLMVEDVRTTVEFYRDVLGFKLEMAVPESQGDILTELPEEGGLAYALVRNGNAEIMFQSQSSIREDFPSMAIIPIGATISLYMESERIEELYNEIQPKVQVVKELFTTWYGMKEFYFTDNNGYVLCISEQVNPEEA